VDIAFVSDELGATVLTHYPAALVAINCFAKKRLNPALAATNKNRPGVGIEFRICFELLNHRGTETQRREDPA
jgi:hypothetical protein